MVASDGCVWLGVGEEVDRHQFIGLVFGMHLRLVWDDVFDGHVQSNVATSRGLAVGGLRLWPRGRNIWREVAELTYNHNGSSLEGSCVQRSRVGTSQIVNAWCFLGSWELER